jgi:hypothetical protein
MELDLKNNKPKNSKKGKFPLRPNINVEVEEQIEIPKIDKPEIKGDLSFPVSELPKSKVEMRKLFPESKEDIVYECFNFKSITSKRRCSSKFEFRER